MSVAPSASSHTAPRFARHRLLLTLGVIAAVSSAARWQATPPAPASQPPVPAAAPAAPADSLRQDSATVVDSLAPMDSMAMATLPMTIAPAPAPVIPTGAGGWPIDPVTGQTLVNGIPVVGTPFVQQKTDGLIKVETVAQDRQNEALPPDAPIVDSDYTAAPATATRRYRTVMVQATLWSMDHKRSATERRFYRAMR